MTSPDFYKAHWQTIEPERMAAYAAAFGWDATTEAVFQPLELGEGQSVADFGCGPGKVAVEMARRVGAGGHVHALDINAGFLDLTRENAGAAGVSDRVTTHLNDGTTLPFADGALDRIAARNALMYVDDTVATLSEFRRVLKPGGVALASDGDWYMMVAEPVPHDLWRRFVIAAGHACRHADMGRKLAAGFRAAGFAGVEISIHAAADTAGSKLGMIRNMAAYARESGAMPLADIDRVVAIVEEGLGAGTYLVVSPQFAVTARAG